MTWDEVKQQLRVGERVQGVVTHLAPYGIFVSIPGIPFAGLVQITDFKDTGMMTPEEYPAIGSTVVGVVLGFKGIGQQIWLGMKPSQLAASVDGRQP